MSHQKKQSKLSSTQMSKEISEKSSKKKTNSQSKVCKTNRQKENLSNTLGMVLHQPGTTRLGYTGICKIVDEKNQTITHYESQLGQLLEQNNELKRQKQQMRTQQIVRLKEYQIKNQESIRQLNYLRQGLSEMKSKLEQLSIQKKTIGVKYHNSLKEIQQLSSNINKLILKEQEGEKYKEMASQLHSQNQKCREKIKLLQNQLEETKYQYQNQQRQIQDRVSNQHKFQSILKDISAKNTQFKAREQDLKIMINNTLQDLQSQRKWGKEQIQSYKIKLKATQQEMNIIRDQLYIQNVNFTSISSSTENLSEELDLKRKIMMKMQIQNKQLQDKKSELERLLIEQKKLYGNLMFENQNLARNHENLIKLNKQQIECHKDEKYKMTEQIARINQQMAIVKKQNQENYNTQLKVNELILQNKRISDINLKDKRQLNQIKQLYNSCTITLQMATKQLQNNRNKYIDSERKLNQQMRQTERLSTELLTKENIISRMLLQQKQYKDQISQLAYTLNCQRKVQEEQNQRQQKIFQKFKILQSSLIQKEAQYDLKIKQYQNNVAQKSNRIKQLQTLIKNINVDLNLVKIQVSEYRKHIEEVSQQRSENQQMIRSLQQKHQQQTLSSQARYQTIFQENSIKNNTIIELKKEIQKVNIQRQQLKSNFQTIRVQCSQLQKQFNSVQLGLKNHQSQKKYLKQALNQSQLKFTNFANFTSQDIRRHQQERQCQRKHIQQLQNNIMKMERSLKHIQQQKEFLQRNSTNLEKKISEINQKNDHLQRNIQNQYENQQHLKKNIQILQSKFSQVTNQLNNHRQYLHNQQRQKQQLKSVIKCLEDKVIKANAERESIWKDLERLKMSNKQGLLQQHINKMEQNQREKNKQYQNSKTTIEILKGQNESLMKIMNQQLNKRRIIIEDLVRQKKQLYDQIRK